MEKYLVIFLIAIVGYVLWKCLNETNEGFGDVAQQSVGGVDDQNAINTLAQIAKDLQAGGLKVKGNLSTDGNMDVAANLNVNGAINFLPKGVIVAWYGEANAVPKGWLLCDGTKNTPDLRDRFIVGTGKEYKLNDIGGSKDVTLTINQLPAHAHKLSTNDFTNKQDDIVTHFRSFGGADGSDRTIRRRHTSNELQEVKVSIEGKGEPHENRPPYYALAWIMKA